MVLDLVSQYLDIDKGALLVPFSILGSAILGSTIALYTVFSHRKISKLKNSMDFVNGYNEDKDIAEAIKEINALKDWASGEIEKMATKDGHCKNTIHIRRVLNYYEALAICLDHKIYNETIIKEAVYTTVLDTWAICLPYVNERRKKEGKQTYYQELSILITRWTKNPLKKKKY